MRAPDKNLKKRLCEIYRDKILCKIESKTYMNQVRIKKPANNTGLSIKKLFTSPQKRLMRSSYS